MAVPQQQLSCEFGYDTSSSQLPTGYTTYSELPYVSNTNPIVIQPQDGTNQSCVPPTAPLVMPLTVRVSILNLRFMKLQDSSAKTQIQELQSFYYLKSAGLESERFSSLSCATANYCMQSSTNNYFDQQHHSLINRVEHSLGLIEGRVKQAKKQKSERPASKSHEIPKNRAAQSKSGTMNPVAHRILNNWYERHCEHPYPCYEAAEVMAKAGDISVDQVKKWFANKRLRLGHTKHITDIANRRKRARSVTAEDVMLDGCLKSD